MAQFFPHFEDFPLEEQIKALDDEELLDFWEETQHLDRFLEDDPEYIPEESLEYERIILQELRIRSCRRVGAAR